MDARDAYFEFMKYKPDSIFKDMEVYNFLGLIAADELSNSSVFVDKVFEVISKHNETLRRYGIKEFTKDVRATVNFTDGGWTYATATEDYKIIWWINTETIKRLDNGNILFWVKVVYYDSEREEFINGDPEKSLFKYNASFIEYDPVYERERRLSSVYYNKYGDVLQSMNFEKDAEWSYVVPNSHGAEIIRIAKHNSTMLNK